MDSFEESLASIIYLFYIDEIKANLIEETIIYTYSKKDIKIYYDINPDVMRMIKNNNTYFNVHFLKRLYLSMISKMEADFDCSNIEDFNSHKAQIFIFIVYFLYEIYDGLYDSQAG